MMCTQEHRQNCEKTIPGETYRTKPLLISISTVSSSYPWREKNIRDTLNNQVKKMKPIHDVYFFLPVFIHSSQNYELVSSSVNKNGGVNVVCIEKPYFPEWH